MDGADVSNGRSFLIRAGRVPILLSLVMALVILAVIGLDLAGSPPSTDAAWRSTASRPPGGAGQVTIRARLPAQANECDCKVPPAAHIYSELRDLDLDSGYQDEGITDGGQFFAITFDSRMVPTEKIIQLIEREGGVVIDGPGIRP